MSEREQHVEQFRRNAHMFVDYIADYYRDIEKYNALSQVEPGYLAKAMPSDPPLEPETAENILKEFDQKIIPGVTHWQSPKFFAFFPANNSPASMLGEMLSFMISCIGFNWICSPACTELEVIVLDWMAKALSLPPKFLSNTKGGGVIQGTASEAVLVCMLAARAKIFQKLNAKTLPDTNDINSKLIVYASDQTHSSIQKACQILNISFFAVPSDSTFRLQAETLKAFIEKHESEGKIPFFAVGTMGTTNTAAVDDLEGIGAICRERGIWFHVDAAYAGSACICPEYAHLIKGTLDASSFNFNMHKWLLTGFDCSLLWVEDRKYLIDALSISPEYLKNKASESGAVIDYRDWQIPLGRRFRSLKVWLVLKFYGLNFLQNYIRQHIDLAEEFHNLMVAHSDSFEIISKSYSLVCWRAINKNSQESEELEEEKKNELNKALLESINQKGYFLSGTTLRGKFILRVAVGTPFSTSSHISSLFNCILDAYRSLSK
eukprot:TRINITY_DN8769_c0_g1_i1.p1 TRINITY_DN8769_c0_g1~~TRINITY_DN8769_c0_g1_i1.p1  ORF type:complete len:502 (-),score=106.83 TRINITY_DN8769_c0_g1_i1:15-1487(-)